MARMRTFIGVDVSDGVRRAATVMQQKLTKTGAAVKWVEPANLHVTLLFLGDLDDRDTVDVCKAVSAVAADEPPFRLAVAGLGAFPTPRRPKTLWAGITDGADALTRVFNELETRLGKLGLYRKEERPFAPHLTLGRVADEAAGQLIAPELPKYADWAGGAADVDEIIVYTSVPDRKGQVYTPLGRGRLGGDD